MLPDVRDAAHLYDMAKFSRDVIRYLNGKAESDLLTDELLNSAVERKIELIGEAARRVSIGFRQATPEIPWRKIIATRNVLVHDYDEVNSGTIWRIAQTHLPDLIIRVEQLLAPPPAMLNPDPDHPPK